MKIIIPTLTLALSSGTAIAGGESYYPQRRPRTKRRRPQKGVHQNNALQIYDHDSPSPTCTSFDPRVRSIWCSWSVTRLDMNGDGKIDLAFASPDGSIVAYALGTPSGLGDIQRVSSPSWLAAKAMTALVTDTNGDGRSDFFLAETSSSSSTTLPHGRLTAMPITPKPTGSSRPMTPPHQTQASIPDFLDDSRH
jgi:FG-GAP-like repeat